MIVFFENSHRLVLVCGVAGAGGAGAGGGDGESYVCMFALAVCCCIVIDSLLNLLDGNRWVCSMSLTRLISAGRRRRSLMSLASHIFRRWR